MEIEKEFKKLQANIMKLELRIKFLESKVMSLDQGSRIVLNTPEHGNGQGNVVDRQLRFSYT